MAFTHVQFNDQLQHGRLLRRGLSQLEEGISVLQQAKGTMAMMIDGDGSNIAHFSEFVTRFGFGSTTDAKAAWDELNSLLSKLTTDAQVTFVNAAMVQAFAKFR